MKLERASKQHPYFKKDPRSGFYWVDAYWKEHPTKKRISVSTKERLNKDRALERAHKIYNEWRFSETGTSKRVRFSYALERMIKKKRFTVKESTIRKIENVAKNHLLTEFGDLWVDEAAQYWDEYVAGEPACIQESYVYFKATLSLAVKEGYLRKMPEPELTKPKPSEFEGRAATRQEWEALQNHASGDISIILNLGLCHGMRSAEIFKLEWSRIDFEKQTIRLRRSDTKIKKPREFPVYQSILDAIQARGVIEDSPYLFPSPVDPSKPIGSFKRSWNTLKRRAGIDGSLRFHDMRVTFLTEAARQIKEKTSNFSAVEICLFAGVSLEVFMKHYLKIKPEDLRQITEVIAVKMGER